MIDRSKPFQWERSWVGGGYILHLLLSRWKSPNIDPVHSPFVPTVLLHYSVFLSVFCRSNFRQRRRSFTRFISLRFPRGDSHFTEITPKLWYTHTLLLVLSGLFSFIFTILSLCNGKKGKKSVQSVFFFVFLPFFVVFFFQDFQAFRVARAVFFWCILWWSGYS